MTSQQSSVTIDLGPAVRKALDKAGMPVFAEIAAERARQDEKWGEQNHPDLAPPLPRGIDGPRSRRIGVARYYGIPTATLAKRLTDDDTAAGECSWLAIATEELAEAAEAAADGDEQAVRAEVVQLAAVCVQWVQAIDRRGSR